MRDSSYTRINAGFFSSVEFQRNMFTWINLPIIIVFMNVIKYMWYQPHKRNVNWMHIIKITHNKR